MTNETSLCPAIAFTNRPPPRIAHLEAYTRHCVHSPILVCRHAVHECQLRYLSYSFSPVNEKSLSYLHGTLKAGHSTAIAGCRCLR